jgi:uncharacterized protein
MRFIYTIGQAWKYRHQIRAMRTPQLQVQSVTEVTPARLELLGVRYLALDFDGVLAPHGDEVPTAEVAVWLREMVAYLGAESVFILSNKPTAERAAYFTEHFAGVCFIGGVRKKPYPDGLQKIQQLLGCMPDQLALVDDRLLTGCLACMIAGSQPILLTDALRNPNNRPMEEFFFKCLRVSEQWLFLR